MVARSLVRQTEPSGERGDGGLVQTLAGPFGLLAQGAIDSRGYLAEGILNRGVRFHARKLNIGCRQVKQRMPACLHRVGIWHRFTVSPVRRRRPPRTPAFGPLALQAPDGPDSVLIVPPSEFHEQNREGWFATSSRWSDGLPSPESETARLVCSASACGLARPIPAPPQCIAENSLEPFAGLHARPRVHASFLASSAGNQNTSPPSRKNRVICSRNWR